MGIGWYFRRFVGDNPALPFYDGVKEINVKYGIWLYEWDKNKVLKDEHKETTAIVRFDYRPFEDRWSFPNAITDLNGKCYNFKDLHPMCQTRINREVNRVTGEWRKTKGAPKRKTKPPSWHRL